MNKPYLVRCTASQNRLEDWTGLYVAAVTESGLMADLSPETARHFTEAAALEYARVLNTRFPYSTWAVFPVLPDAYLVRCTVAAGRALEGVYLAGLTLNGMVATWKPARARQFDNPAAAADVISCLASKFHGTKWTAETVGVDL